MIYISLVRSSHDWISVYKNESQIIYYQKWSRCKFHKYDFLYGKKLILYFSIFIVCHMTSYVIDSSICVFHEKKNPYINIIRDSILEYVYIGIIHWFTGYTQSCPSPRGSVWKPPST